MLDIRKDFPNLKEKNRGKNLVYLDSAATSLTPKQVINSESEYYEKFGGSIHRSVYEPVSYTHLTLPTSDLV